MPIESVSSQLTHRGGGSHINTLPNRGKPPNTMGTASSLCLEAESAGHRAPKVLGEKKKKTKTGCWENSSSIRQLWWVTSFQLHCLGTFVSRATLNRIQHLHTACEGANLNHKGNLAASLEDSLRGGFRSFHPTHPHGAGAFPGIHSLHSCKLSLSQGPW